MSRSLVYLREASPADAPRLADLWGDVLRRGDDSDHLADMLRVVETLLRRRPRGVVAAEYDGELAGAVHLRLTTTPRSTWTCLCRSCRRRCSRSTAVTASAGR